MPGSGWIGPPREFVDYFPRLIRHGRTYMGAMLGSIRNKRVFVLSQDPANLTTLAACFLISERNRGDSRSSS